MKDKNLFEVMEKYQNGPSNVDVQVSPEFDITPAVSGTLDDKTFENNTPTFFSDLGDYAKYAGINQTATGIVEAVTNPFTYPKEEGYSSLTSPAFTSQDPEFRKRFVSDFSDLRSEQHTIDTLRRVREQVAIEERIFDPNYDANNFAAVLGSLAGGIFDITNAIPIHSFMVAKKMAQAIKVADKAKDLSKSYIRSAKMLSLAGGSAQFAGAEALREIAGQSTWSRPMNEIVPQVALAGLLGGTLHTLVDFGKAKRLVDMPEPVMVKAQNEIIDNSLMDDFTPGDMIAEPDSFIGKHLSNAYDASFGTASPRIRMGRSTSDPIRDFIYKTSGTAYEKVGKDGAAPVEAAIETVTQKYTIDLTSFETKSFPAYKARGGELSKELFTRKMSEVMTLNDGKYIEDFVSSGIDEVDDFYKTVIRPTHKEIGLRSKAIGDLEGVDLEKGWSPSKRISEDALLDEGTAGTKLLARAMESADKKTMARFLDLETQLKNLGFKITRAGKLMTKNIEEFRQAVKGTNSEKMLDEYLSSAEDITKVGENFDSFRKNATTVRKNYMPTAEKFREDILTGRADEKFAQSGSGKIGKSGHNLDWEILAPIADQDYYSSVRKSTRAIVMRQEVFRRFGTHDPVKQVDEQARALFKEQSKTMNKDQIVKAKQKLLSELEDVNGHMNRIKGLRANGSREYGWLETGVAAMRTAVNVTFLPAGIVAQITDLVNFFDNFLATSFSRMEPNIRSIADPDMLGIDTYFNKRFGVEQLTGLDSRAAKMHGDTIDLSMNASDRGGVFGVTPKKVAEFFRGVDEKLFTWNGMTMWNNKLKSITFKENMVSIVNLAKIADEGNLSKISDDSIAFLNKVNLDEANLKKIYADFKKNPNMSTWDSQRLDDIVAKIKHNTSEFAVIEPGAGDKAHILDNPLAQPFSFLKGFTFAGMSRYTGRDLKSGSRGGARTMGRMILAVAAYTIKASMREDGPNFDLNNLIGEAFSRSGSFAGIDFVSETADQFGVGLHTLLGADRAARRFYNGNTTLMNVLVGPSAGVLQNVNKTVQKAIDGKMTVGDAAFIATSIAVLNQKYITYPLEQLKGD